LPLIAPKTSAKAAAIAPRCPKANIPIAVSAGARWNPARRQLSLRKGAATRTLQSGTDPAEEHNVYEKNKLAAVKLAGQLDLFLKRTGNAPQTSMTRSISKASKN